MRPIGIEASKGIEWKIPQGVAPPRGREKARVFKERESQKTEVTGMDATPRQVLKRSTGEKRIGERGDKKCPQ